MVAVGPIFRNFSDIDGDISHGGIRTCARTIHYFVLYRVSIFDRVDAGNNISTDHLKNDEPQFEERGNDAGRCAGWFLAVYSCTIVGEKSR